MKVTKEQLAELLNVPAEQVTVPVFGTVWMRGMSGVQRDAFDASCIEGRGKKRDVNIKNVRAKVVVACTYDSQNAERFFSDGDLDALSQGRADVLDRLYTVGARLSGISSEDEDNLGKPLGTETPSASSSSPSLAN